MNDDKVLKKTIKVLETFLDLLRSDDEENERLREENEQLKHEVEKNLSLVRYWKSCYENLGGETPSSDTSRRETR